MSVTSSHQSKAPTCQASSTSFVAGQELWDEVVRRWPALADEFAEKVEDIVGLYMDPPMQAVVLSIDEKSQIQALDRTRSPGVLSSRANAPAECDGGGPVSQARH